MSVFRSPESIEIRRRKKRCARTFSTGQISRDIWETTEYLFGRTRATAEETISGGDATRRVRKEEGGRRKERFREIDDETSG